MANLSTTLLRNIAGLPLVKPQRSPIVCLYKQSIEDPDFLYLDSAIYAVKRIRKYSAIRTLVLMSAITRYGERKSDFSELQDMHDVDRLSSFRVDKSLCRAGS